LVVYVVSVVTNQQSKRAVTQNFFLIPSCAAEFGVYAPLLVIGNMSNNGHPLPAPVRERLQALVEIHGQYEAATRLGVGAATVARALAGLGVRRATRTALELGIEKVATEQAA